MGTELLTGRIHVLHIEDDPQDAELVSRELRRGGLDAEIHRVQDPGTLRRMLADRRPDVVLCDYRMPTLEAPQAFAIVREVLPDVPFLCVSGTIGEERAVELLKMGVTDYILKDQPARLVPGIHRALAEAGERAARARAEDELRVSREQFLQAQKMEAVGRLAGGVAHDFNNILTTISGYAELMLISMSPDAAERAEVAEILHASERAAKLTRQLLAFSRRQVFEVRVLDINEVVSGVDSMLHRLIGENIRIQLSLSPAARRVRADAGQLEQVLMNLAVNARDAMPTGGMITITTRDAGDSTELVFQDDGTGMTPEVKARVFEPFFTTKEMGKGTGLGLATVYGIVQQSGGTIEIDSAPGRGARFTIRLPATDESAEARRPRATPAAHCPVASEAILVVEDESPLRTVLCRVLRQNGYTVVEADGPAAALKALETTGPLKLAVVDLVMPGLDGASLVKSLRERRPDLRVLFISGYADQVELPRPEDGRAFPFLAKPFSSDLLFAKIRETIDEPL